MEAAFTQTVTGRKSRKDRLAQSSGAPLPASVGMRSPELFGSELSPAAAL